MKATTQQNDVGPGDVLKSSVIGSQVMGYYDACVDLASKGLAFIRLTRLGALPVQFSFVFTKSEGDSSAELGGTIYVPSPQGATPQCIYTTATGTPVKFESLGRSASLTAGTLYLMTCNIPRDQVNTGGSFLISTRSYMYVDVLIPGGVPLSYVELLVDKVAALQARTDNLEFTVTQTASALEVLFRAVVARGVFALGGEPTTLLAFMQQKVPVTSRTTGNDGSARWRDCHYSATLLQWSGPYLFTSRSIRIGDGGESGGTGNWAVMNFGTVRGKGDFEARCEDVFSVGGAGGCSAGGSAYGMSVALWGSATSSDCSMPQGWNLLYRLPAGPGDGAFNNARGRWDFVWLF
ncbi:hypothetical protein HYH02_008858 [Chlamydomonas schloesseri]|uniref:Uncharacterized protein n=1 Tax=Chlamydomonas schloesseri TaxID=2026947 RepID=A0A835WCT8_9CHLO|nr:hypothetical protein HYH02_008858 [Chlamydomonas schloesseri]|eukprot:KAG2444988.1 hypothetical protein HYH02_008858 [Chlamydomonas schloesseri]